MVDDDASLRGVLHDLMVEIGYTGIAFVSERDAFAKVVDTEPLDLIVLDLRPEQAGALRRRAATAFPHVPIVAIGDDNCESILEAMFEVLRTTHKRRSDRERQRARVRLARPNDELSRAGGIDQLTGIANRELFDTLLSAEWLRCARHGLSLSLAMIDLDDFRAYNAKYGHRGGDICLRRVAETLTRCLRRPADIVARHHGGKLVVLLPDTGLAEASVAADRLRARVEQLQLPHAGSRDRTVVTASVGVATALPRHDVSCRTLISAADRALRLAKQSGRNRTCGDGVRPMVDTVARQRERELWPLVDERDSPDEPRKLDHDSPYR